MASGGGWPTPRYAAIGAVLAVVLAGCGSEENADEYANGHLGDGKDAGADAKVGAASLTGQVAPDASQVEDALSNSVDVATSNDTPSVTDSAAADAAYFDASPVDAGVSVADGAAEAARPLADAETGPDSCAGDACGSIGVDINVCPQLSGFTVNPVVVAVGEGVHLTSSAIDGNGDPLLFHWTATQGSFVDANAANTTFRCATIGTATVSLTVSDGKCDDGFDQDIQCN